MDELRILLLGIGALIIAALYLWGTRARIRAGIEEIRRRRRVARRGLGEPMLDGSAADRPDDEPVAEMRIDAGSGARGDNLDHMRLVDVEIRRIDREASPQPSRAAAEPPGPTRTVLLTIMAPDEQPFPGIRILEAADELDLKLSRSGVLDCLTETDSGGGKIVFSIGHLREPGTFGLDSIRALRTPGLLLFQRLPGPSHGLVSVDLMLTVANQLARILGGTLADERGRAMGRDELLAFRQEAARFERQCRAEVDA